MVQRGARNFVYVSRGGTSSAAATELIEQLSADNVRTVVVQCDITDAQKLSAALGTVLKTLPPLRGVIQGAMVLNDATFTSMTHSSFMSTLRPKVQGSWALHHVTMEHKAPLNFFIMLSSAAAFVGNAGQANYVAGCTYQGALAKYRRHHLRLPATAIDIGKVAGVGFVAESSGTITEANLTRLGLPDISEAELLSMLEFAMMSCETGVDEDEHIVTGVTDIARRPSGEYANEEPFWARDPVFSHLPYARPHSLQRGKVSTHVNKKGEEMGATMAQILARLDETGDDLAAQHVSVVLAQRLARALMIPADEVDTLKSPANLGADSLVAIEIRNWLIREADIEVPVFDILQAASVAALAGNLLNLAKAKRTVVQNGTK